MKKWSLDFGEFEITFREILASISIIAVMLLIGFVISGKISQNNIDANEKYNKAIKIDNDKDMFQYGMETNVGNAFVHGKLKAVDTVTFPEIGGKYMYVKKVEEHYNMHTQTYTTTDSKGHTQTHTRTYWSWDYAGEESKECKEINFCNTKFSSKKIEHPSTSYIKTIKESSHVRFKYYGTGTKFNGTFLLGDDKSTSALTLAGTNSTSTTFPSLSYAFKVASLIVDVPISCLTILSTFTSAFTVATCLI